MNSENSNEPLGWNSHDPSRAFRSVVTDNALGDSSSLAPQPPANAIPSRWGQASHNSMQNSPMGPISMLHGNSVAASDVSLRARSMLTDNNHFGLGEGFRTMSEVGVVGLQQPGLGLQPQHIQEHHQQSAAFASAAAHGSDMGLRTQPDNSAHWMINPGIVSTLAASITPNDPNGISKLAEFACMMGIVVPGRQSDFEALVRWYVLSRTSQPLTAGGAVEPIQMLLQQQQHVRTELPSETYTSLFAAACAPDPIPSPLPVATTQFDSSRSASSPAAMELPIGTSSNTSSTAEPAPSRTRRKYRHESFPEKLHRMLCEKRHEMINRMSFRIQQKERLFKYIKQKSFDEKFFPITSVTTNCPPLRGP